LNRSANGKDNIYGFAIFLKISKPNIGIKARRNSRMETTKIKRELLSVLMESPFYFNIPLKNRLEFIIFFSQQSVYRLAFKHNRHLMSEKSDSRGEP
jgi:hypothetical protein